MEDSWAHQVQILLQTQVPDREVEVVNAGLPGRTSADSLVNLGLRVLPLNPDVVVLVHGVNDQKPNRYPGFRPDYSHWYRQARRSGGSGAMGAIIDHSLFAAHLRYRLKFAARPAFRDNWRGEALERFDTVGREGLDAYRRNLESMVAMARAHGARVVVCTVAHSISEGNGDWAPESGSRCPLLHYHSTLTLQGIENAFLEYNRVTRDVAGRFGCSLVDWAKHMPRGAEYFADDVHFTARGAKAAATGVAEEVSELLESGKAAR